MAVQLDSGEYLSRTANLPPISGVTICGWGAFDSVPALSWKGMLSFGQTGTQPSYQIGLVNPGGLNVFGISDGNGTVNDGAGFGWKPGVLQPVFVALTQNGSALQGYARRINERNFSYCAISKSGGTMQSVRVGTTTFDGTDYMVGRMWNIKCWDRVLTWQELLQESWFRRVRNTAALNFHWLLDRHDDLSDQSGNNRPATSTGTISTVPPLWDPLRGPPRRIIAYSPAGGTTFTKSIGGTLTPAGGLTKQTLKILGGTLTPAGSLTKLTSKLLAGALSPAGSLTKQTQKSFGGTLIPSGSLAVTLVFLKSVAGTLTPVGALTKMTLKALAGALAPVGALVKQTRKVLAGTLSPAGSLTKQTSKKLTGTVTPTGTLTPAAVILKALAGTLSFIGSLSTLFIPFVPPSGTIRRYWRSLWSRQWRDPGQKDIDN